MRSIPSGSAGSIVPTCHSFCRASDGLDLLCGVSSGEGELCKRRLDTHIITALKRCALQSVEATHPCFAQRSCWLPGHDALLAGPGQALRQGFCPSNDLAR